MTLIQRFGSARRNVSKQPAQFQETLLTFPRVSDWEYVSGNDGPLAMTNPSTATDENGAFSLVVSRHLFQDPCGCTACTGYRAGELGLGIFQRSASTLYSHHEIEIVKLDTTAATDTVGELRFSPASSHEAK